MRSGERSSKVWQFMNRALAVALTALLIAPRATADTYAGRALDLTAQPVGSPGGAPTSGLGGVDARSGAANFTYHFALPPGRDGLTPALNLTYSSEFGNSWVGRGFALDTPMIQRDTRRGVPSYSASDRFVFVADGAAQTLVGPMSTGASGDAEYRLVEDEGDVRFLLHAADSTWRVQTRDGHESTYEPAVALAAAPTSIDQVFTWRLTKVRDGAGNTIRYEYLVATDGEFAAEGPGDHAGQIPRLRRIWYGGNEDASGHERIGPLFQISFDYMGATPPPELVTSPPRANQAECDNAPGRPDYRAGGELAEPDGTSNLLFGIAVQVVAPGTTDGTQREYALRRAHAWQFRYNWDRIGCTNADQFWPALVEIDSTGWDEDGTPIPDQPVTFGYYPWTRNLVRRGPFVTPPSTNFFPDGTPAGGHPASPSVGVVMTNHDLARGDGQIGLYARDVDGDPGVVEALVDVDADGVPDLLDLGRNPSCFGNSGVFCPPDHPSGGTCPSAISTDLDPDDGGQWFRFAPPAAGGAGGFEPSARDWSWDHTLLEWDDEGAGGSDVNCALAPRRTIAQQTALTSVSAHQTYARLLDVDGDGFLDVLRSSASSAPSSLRWYPSLLAGSPTSVGFGGRKDLSDPPWFHDTLPLEDVSPWELTDLTLEQIFPAACGYGQALTWASDEAGFLADFTGDGLPDRLAIVSNGTESNLAVWPATAPGVWGPPQAWALAGERNGALPLSPATTVAPNEVLTGLLCPGTVGLEVDSERYTTNHAFDMNGDGLLDLVTDEPRITRRNANTPDYTAELRVGRLRVASNYGAGFVTFARPTGRTTGWSEDVMPSPYFGLDRTEYGVAGWTSGHFPGRVRTTVQVVDYNGDGLPDLVSSETSDQAPYGWYALNRGNGFGPTYALPEIDASTLFEDVQVQPVDPIERVSTQQAVADFTGDGRPDVLRLDFTSATQGNGGVYYLYTDPDDGSAPGRLHVIDNGRGATTTFEYQTLTAAVRGANQGVPVHRWVVQRQVTNPGDGQAIATSYTYESPQFLPDPARTVSGDPLIRANGFRGFAAVTAHLPGHLDVRTSFDFDVSDRNAPRRDGLPTLVEYRDTNVVPPAPLRTIQTHYDDVFTSAVSGERSVRHPVHRVDTTEYPAGGGRSFTTSTEFTYTDGLSLPTLVTQHGDPSDSRLVRTMKFAYASPSTGAMSYRRLLARHELFEGTDTTASPLRRVSLQYDNHADQTFTNGFLTRVDVLSTTAPEHSVALTLTNDALGHPMTLSGPVIPEWGAAPAERFCWDAFDMYPVIAQDQARSVTHRVVSYATGATLVASGPTGFDNSTDITCPTVPPRYSWQSRLSPVPPLSGTPEGQEAATPPIQPPPPPSSIGPDRDHSKPIGDDVVTPRESVAGVLAAAVAPRELVGIDTVPFTPPATGLGPAAPSGIPTSVRQPTSWFLYDGLGRLTAAYATQRQNPRLTPPLPGVHTTFDLPQLLENFYNFDPYSSSTTVTSLQFLDDATTIVSQRAFDGSGRPTIDRVVDPGRGEPVTMASRAYDERGLLRVLETPHPGLDGVRVRTTIDARDAWGRAISVTLPDHTSITQTYRERRDLTPDGPAGTLVVNAIVGTARRSEVETDSFGRLAAARTFAGEARSTRLETTYDFDAADALLGMQTPDGAVTTWTRDRRGLPTHIARFYAPAEQMRTPAQPSDDLGVAYDDAGEIKTVTDHAGLTTTYNRDTFGRLRTVVVPPDPSLPNGYGNLQFGYDDSFASTGLGLLRTMRSRSEETGYAYDAAGRVSRTSHSIQARFERGGGAPLNFSDQYAFDYAYNRADEPTSVAYDLDATSADPSTLEQLQYTYDARGDLETIADAVPGSAPVPLAHWTRDEAGFPVLRADEFGGREVDRFDEAGRVTSIDVAGRDGTAWSQSISYSTGRPTHVTTAPTALGGTSDWDVGFDDADRLTSIDSGDYSLAVAFHPTPDRPRTQIDTIDEHTAGGDTSYVYDFAGEPSSGALTSADPDAVDAIRVGGAPARDYGHDLNGSVTSVTSHGSGGSTSTTRYRVDSYGHIHEIDYPDGHHDEFLYDALGNRTHVYDGARNQVIATHAGLVDLVYRPGSSTRSDVAFLAGLSSTPIARVHHGADASRRLMHLDAFGNVAFVRSSTDGAHGTQPNRFDYGPFGPLGDGAGSSPEGELRGYHGGLVDRSGGSLVTFGARVYDTYSRRWMSRDPIARGGGGGEPYQYVFDNPLVYDDPSGLDPPVDTGDPISWMTGEINYAVDAVWNWSQATVARSDANANVVASHAPPPILSATPPGAMVSMAFSDVEAGIRFPADLVSALTGANGRGGANTCFEHYARWIRTGAMVSMVFDGATSGAVNDIVDATFSDLEGGGARASRGGAGAGGGGARTGGGGGRAGGGRTYFVHGTGRDHVASIWGGLNEAQIRAISQGSNSEGAFFAGPSGPPGNPGPAGQVFADWAGNRYGSNWALMSGSLPTNVLEEMLANGSARLRPLEGMWYSPSEPVMEYVFQPESFANFNNNVIWHWTWF